MLNQNRFGYGVRFNFNSYKDFIPNMHWRYEMLDGDVIPVPIPAIKNQAICLKIASALLRYAEARRLGQVLASPCNVILSEKTVMQPDIAFIKSDRRGLIGKRSLRGAPDLVIDVLSPVIRIKDLQLKKRIYERFKVREYWQVDPDEGVVDTMIWSELGYISVCGFGKTDRLSSPLLPNLDLDLSRVFEAGDR